jgi:hypothetical protein
MIQAFLDYYSKAQMMQSLKYEGGSFTEEEVNDELVWNVPIYDVVHRKYASFSSLLEALYLGEKDPKGNGVYFNNASEKIQAQDFIVLCYLFRLCGSGINYKPKVSTPIGSHGFGNFWIVDQLLKGEVNSQKWIDNIPQDKFCDCKGYLLPMIKGGLRNFIRNESLDLIDFIMEFATSNSCVGIKKIVDHGNKWLLSKGYQRQNFVLTAFAMDLAEYFPELVDRDSDTYVGSNAKKCLKMILPELSHDAALRHLCYVTNNVSKPYDMEDVACDFIRYINNYQSSHHIDMNNGIVYKNNINVK